MAGGLKIAFPIELVEKLLRLEIGQGEDDGPAAAAQLRGQRDRIFEHPLRRADQLGPTSLGGFDPFLRLFLIEEIFLEFPRGMRCAKFLEPLLFRALVGERLVTRAAPRKIPG